MPNECSFAEVDIQKLRSSEELILPTGDVLVRRKVTPGNSLTKQMGGIFHKAKYSQQPDKTT